MNGSFVGMHISAVGGTVVMEGIGSLGYFYGVDVGLLFPLPSISLYNQATFGKDMACNIENMLHLYEHP